MISASFKMKLKSTRAQAQGGTDLLSLLMLAVLTFIVLGAIVGAGGMVMGNLKDNQQQYECAAGYPMNGSSCCQAGYPLNASGTCLNCTMNATDGTLCGGTLNGTATVGASSATSDFNTTVDESVDSLLELTSWAETMALIIAAVFIIGLIMLMRLRRV